MAETCSTHWEIKNAKKVVVEKPEVKRLLGREE
jgi:hypothetical protein